MPNLSLKIYVDQMSCFSGDEVLLIDSNWAGKVNEMRCPLLNLSGSVRWPREAKELETEYTLTGHEQTTVPSQIIRIDSV